MARRRGSPSNARRYSGRSGARRRGPRTPKPKFRAAFCATCLVDQFYPEVGVAAVKTLRRAGVDVSFPEEQTCCGQIAFNGGFRSHAAEAARRFLDVFESEEQIVVPSGSCASMIKVYYLELFEDDPDALERARAVGEKTREFSDYLVNVVGAADIGSADGSASAQGLVTYHDACHLLRELRISDAPRALIGSVPGVELQEMADADACCGFGGLFSVKFPEISTAILDEKLRNIAESGASAVVANDCGCLMHIRGAMERRGIKARAMHLAELLAGDDA